MIRPVKLPPGLEDATLRFGRSQSHELGQPWVL